MRAVTASMWGGRCLGCEKVGCVDTSPPAHCHHLLLGVLVFPWSQDREEEASIAMETSPEQEQTALPTNCSCFNRCWCWFCCWALLGAPRPVTIFSRWESWRNSSNINCGGLAKWATAPGSILFAFLHQRPLCQWLLTGFENLFRKSSALSWVWPSDASTKLLNWQQLWPEGSVCQTCQKNI